jgi:NAD(P)-dependent dehydrogenase (short-subunit alcohol dehydrogenase family)
LRFAHKFTQGKNKMTILVVGASGATGRLLVQQLLDGGEAVKIVIRAESNVFESIHDHVNLAIVRASILDLNDAEINQLVEGCSAIVSCLGHTLSFKGIYAPPRRLVTDTTRRLCKAAKHAKSEAPVKFILMNTTGNSNRDIPEQISFGQTCVMWLLRLLLPPHVDNENAADFLRTEVGQNDTRIEWVAVRPDSLTDEDEVTNYEIYPSPTRSAIFDAGSTSRINVGNFMARLISDRNIWEKWKGQMPVIYNVT